jgi:hypothetical protein
MNGLGVILILLLAALPITWLVAEFKSKRSLRILLGTSSLALSVAAAYGLADFGTMLNYNAWFGGATQRLIKTSVTQLEDGHMDRVLKAWRALEAQYHPSYENRGGYEELVDGATAAMEGRLEIPPGSKWDGQPFDTKSWLGYWENDTGFWIFIDDTKNPVSVIRSGDPPMSMRSATRSEDHLVMKIQEDDHWLHTLTLKNKFEATHVWFDLKEQKIWQIGTLHKLRRATPAERAATAVTGGPIPGSPKVDPPNKLERP